MKILNPNKIWFFKVSNNEEYNKLFAFARSKDDFYSKSKRNCCGYCGEDNLMWQYIYMIHRLKKANLLPKDYKMICCKCYEYNKEDKYFRKFVLKE